MGEDARRVKQLLVRTRRVLGARRRASDATVHCPPRSRSIPATECLACGDCEGAVNGRDGSYLRCAHPAAQQAVFAELMRKPLFASAADRTPLSEVMTGDVVCVMPDLSLEVLLALLLERNIGGAPVVDDDGRAIGVVSRSDLLGGFQAGMTVADVMMGMAFTLPDSASLSQAAALMAIEGVHRIPVVAADGGVVGIVTSLDVARWLAQSDGTIAPDQSGLPRRGPDEDESH